VKIWTGKLHLRIAIAALFLLVALLAISCAGGDEGTVPLNPRGWNVSTYDVSCNATFVITYFNTGTGQQEQIPDGTTITYTGPMNTTADAPLSNGVINAGFPSTWPSGTYDISLDVPGMGKVDLGDFKYTQCAK
jgi:hypothetical protein